MRTKRKIPLADHYDKLKKEERIDLIFMAVKRGDRKSEEEKSKGNNFPLIPSFAEDTAVKTGITPRTIRQEIQIATDLIPPLTDKEKILLEESILSEGCRDPLVLWEREDGSFVLIDGHNRKGICDRNKLTYPTKSLKFENVEQVKQWVILNQIGRRNLTDERYSKMVAEYYKSVKKEHGGDRKANR